MTPGATCTAASTSHPPLTAIFLATVSLCITSCRTLTCLCFDTAEFLHLINILVSARTFGCTECFSVFLLFEFSRLQLCCFFKSLIALEVSILASAGSSLQQKNNSKKDGKPRVSEHNRGLSFKRARDLPCELGETYNRAKSRMII